MPIKQYVQEVRRFMNCIGNMEFAVCQDYMCEPQILAKTGLTVAEHQRRTLNNYRELMQLAPEVPWAPVLQGFTIGEYWEHAMAYQKAGVELAKAPVVGCGTLCRRQNTTRANALLATLQADGIRTHAFGYKVRGLMMAHEHVQSADSLAWSYNARRHPPLPECRGEHDRCNNCIRWALRWRTKLLKALNIEEPPREEPPVQGTLF